MVSKERPDAHTCHAKGCRRRCNPEMLMCYPHWRMVPPAIQRAVWATYQDGQCDGNPLPSERWHVAADAAIWSVAQKEGHLRADLRPNKTVADWETIRKEAAAAKPLSAFVDGGKA